MEKRSDNRGLFFWLHTYRFMTSAHHVTESGRTTPDIHPTICTHRTHDLYTSHPTICTHCIQRSVHIARTIYTHHTLRSVHIASYGLYTSHARSVHIARRAARLRRSTSAIHIITAWPTTDAIIPVYSKRRVYTEWYTRLNCKSPAIVCYFTETFFLPMM